MPYNNSKGPKMESAKQERKDLLRDNPVVRDMDSSRPWMSKHFQSSMSPLKDGHDSPAEKELSAKQKAAFGGGKNPGLEAALEAAPEMKMDGMSMKYGGPEMNHGDGPEMAYGKGPEMDYSKGPKMSALHKEFSIEEAKKRMEERKRKEKAEEEAKK
jgi:hypothetical protein